MRTTIWKVLSPTESQVNDNPLLCLVTKNNTFNESVKKITTSPSNGGKGARNSPETVICYALLLSDFGYLSAGAFLASRWRF